MQQVVIGVQDGGYGAFGHNPIPGKRGTGCPSANRMKYIPGGAFLIPATLNQVARARVGEHIDLGVATCSCCGAKRQFIMAQTHGRPPSIGRR